MDQFPPQTPDPNTQPASPIPAIGQHPEQLAYAPPGYQPGYPSAPAPGEPGYSTPYPTHKSRKGRWIVLLIVAVLLLGGAGTAVYFVNQIQNVSGANGTLQTFCDGYKNLDAHVVYDTLSTHMQTQPSNSESSIQSAFSGIKNLGGKITGCTVSNVQQSGSTATGTITVAAVNGKTSNNIVETLKLKQEGGQWKVDDITAHQ